MALPFLLDKVQIVQYGFQASAWFIPAHSSGLILNLFLCGNVHFSHSNFPDNSSPNLSSYLFSTSFSILLYCPLPNVLLLHCPCHLLSILGVFLYVTSYKHTCLTLKFGFDTPPLYPHSTQHSPPLQHLTHTILSVLLTRLGALRENNNNKPCVFKYILTELTEFLLCSRYTLFLWMSDWMNELSKK